MSTVRTFVRFTLAALFVNALAVACVAENGDDDECDSGATQSCVCSDGAEGTRTCNASGSGYGVCDCAQGSGGEGPGGGNAGGASGGGAGNNGGESPGGGGGQANGGAAGDGGASGSDSSGGVGNAAGAAGGGGEGGGGDTTPELCLNPADACEDCYFSCCDEWVACTDDATCTDEFIDILACTDAIKVDRDVAIADLASCADQVGTTGGGWSSGLTPQTIAMVNCLGGDPSSDTWSGQAAWPADSCNDGCFKK